MVLLQDAPKATSSQNIAPLQGRPAQRELEYFTDSNMSDPIALEAAQNFVYGDSNLPPCDECAGRFDASKPNSFPVFPQCVSSRFDTNESANDPNTSWLMASKCTNCHIRKSACSFQGVRRGVGRPEVGPGDIVRSRRQDRESQRAMSERDSSAASPAGSSTRAGSSSNPLGPFPSMQSMGDVSPFVSGGRYRDALPDVAVSRRSGQVRLPNVDYNNPAEVHRVQQQLLEAQRQLLTNPSQVTGSPSTASTPSSFRGFSPGNSPTPVGRGMPRSASMQSGLSVESPRSSPAPIGRSGTPMVVIPRGGANAGGSSVRGGSERGGSNRGGSQQGGRGRGAAAPGENRGATQQPGGGRGGASAGEGRGDSAGGEPNRRRRNRRSRSRSRAEAAARGGAGGDASGRFTPY